MPSEATNATSELLALYRGLDLPCSVHLEVTRRCNLHCVHCYQARSENHLDTDAFRRILDDLARNRLLFLSFSGGEPLMHPGFFDILAHARSLHFDVQMTTNGTLIDEQTADRIAEIGVSRVSISLYALDPAVHERITATPGSHSRTLAACRFLKDRRVPIRVLCTVTHYNLDQARKVVAWAKDEGFAWLADPVILSGEPGRAVPTHLKPSVEESVRLLDDMDLVPEPFALESAEDPARCGAGVTGAAIDSDGNLKICMVMSQSLGNLLETPFERLWHGSEQRRPFISRRLSAGDRCHGCGLRSICRHCPPDEALERVHDIEAYFDTMCGLARGLLAAWERRHPGEPKPVGSGDRDCGRT